MVLSKISPSSWSQSRKPIMRWIVSASCERRSRCTAAHPQRAGWSAVELNRGWSWWQWWWDSCDSSIIASFPCLFQLLSKRQPFICRVLFSRPSPGPFLWEELWGDNYPPSSLSCLRCKCQENIRGKKKRKLAGNQRENRMTSHQDNDVQDVQEGSSSLASSRVFFFCFYQTGLRRSSGWKNVKKSHRIFPRIVCLPPPFFFSYSNLLCKRIKAWSRAVISCTQHKKEREGENRLTLNNESNTLQSLLHFLYFTLNIERPASQPTIPFRETEKWKLSRWRGVKTEGSLHPLFASFPETDWCCFVVLHTTRPLTFCIMRTERLPTEDDLSSWTACDECWKVTAGEGGGRVLADGSAERAAPAWGAETSGGVCLLGKLWTSSGFLQLEQWLPTESEPRF